MSADEDRGAAVLRATRRTLTVVAVVLALGALAVTRFVAPARQFQAFVVVGIGTVLLAVGAVVYSVSR